MAPCPRCHHPADAGDRFCSACGAPLQGAPAAPRPARAANRSRVILSVAVGALVWGGVAFLVAGRGCSEVKGSFEARGAPLGDFTFTPTRCAAGERMQFLGAILVGDGPTDGGLLVGEDPVKGRFVKVEVPGSCQPPDHEICTEVLLDPAACSVFDVDVERMGIQVNDIRMTRGTLRLECAFPEGGTARASLDFSRCG